MGSPGLCHALSGRSVCTLLSSLVELPELSCSPAPGITDKLCSQNPHTQAEAQTDRQYWYTPQLSQSL